MAYRYIPQAGQGNAKRSSRQHRSGAFISLPQPNNATPSNFIHARASKGADSRADFAVDLDVRHTAKDGKRGSGAC